MMNKCPGIVITFACVGVFDGVCLAESSLFVVSYDCLTPAVDFFIIVGTLV